MADVAAHINLARRLGEREVGRTHPDLGVRTEHLAGEKKDGLLEVGERHILVDVETLYLMEDAVGTGGDRLVPEHTARADDTDRKLHGLHRAHLDGGCVGPQQKRIRMTGGHEEGVLHVSGRMVQREVQRLEHMVVILDLWSLGHIVAEFSEYVNDLLTDNRHRMPRPKLERNSRHRKILLRAVRRSHGSRLVLKLVNLGLGDLLEFIYRTAKLPLKFRAIGPELLEKLGDLSFLAKKPYTGLLNIFGGLAIQPAHIREQLFYSLFHDSHENIPANLIIFRKFGGRLFHLCLSFFTRLPVAGRTALEIFRPLITVQHLPERHIDVLGPFVTCLGVDVKIGDFRGGKAVHLLLHGAVVVVQDGIHIENLPILQFQGHLPTVYLLLNELRQFLLLLLRTRRILLGENSQ